MTDPRPDLKYDSEDWTKLLAMAADTDKDVAGLLHGFRCGGLRLHRGAKGWSLQPDYDPVSSHWGDRGEYYIARQYWLMPHKDTIVQLLRRLGED